jgi:hypothetical protein
MLKEFASCTHWPPPHVVILVGAVPAEGITQLTQTLLLPETPPGVGSLADWRHRLSTTRSLVTALAESRRYVDVPRCIEFWFAETT